jgi:hypothetical protein
MYGTTVEVVHGWETGQGTVPRRVGRDLEEVRGVLAIGDEVERRLDASGLPKCQWLQQQTNLTMAAFQEHAKTCPTCQARDRIATELERQRTPEGLWTRLRRIITG